MSDSFHTVTVTLTAEEEALVTSLGRALLHDAADIYDALWDKTFDESQDLLDQLADETHTEYVAGLTEEFDPDNEDEDC